MQNYRWHMPTEVRLEHDGLDNLSEWLEGWGQKPLIVTGRRSARASGALDRVLAQFPNAAVYDAVDENPETEACDAGAAFCRENACDMVIALGGGSPMDAAKAIAMLAKNPGPCASHFGRVGSQGGALPIAAIPTTAGTGSEVTPYAVLVDSEKQCKTTLKGPELFPRLALLDPVLSATMPREVTLATGLDALSQGMESIVSKKATPIADAMSLDVCRLVRRWLPLAVNEPENLEARAQMLHAAMLSGCAIAQSGTTLVHGMGYYYTLACGVAHGLANALLLPPVFRENAHTQPEQVAQIAAALGFQPNAATPQAVAAAIVDALHSLYADLGLSPAARDAGVDEAKVGDFAQDLAQEPYRFRNQHGEFPVEKLARLFQESVEGT